MIPEKFKILLLAASPAETTELQLDEEVRAIDLVLQQSRLRDQIDLFSHWAVQIDDIAPLLLRHRPVILHFSGHGSINHRIVLKSIAGAAAEVNELAFADLIHAAARTTRCVFLNACYSYEQAQLITTHIPAVIGVSGTISDVAAATFAKSFYLAIGAGESIASAFHIGVAATQMSMPNEVHNLYLFGDAPGLSIPLTAQTDTGTSTTTITNSTIKGMVQNNIGTVTMSFTDASE